MPRSRPNSRLVKNIVPGRRARRSPLRRDRTTALENTQGATLKPRITCNAEDEIHGAYNVASAKEL